MEPDSESLENIGTREYEVQCLWAEIRKLRQQLEALIAAHKEISDKAASGSGSTGQRHSRRLAGRDDQ